MASVTAGGVFLDELAARLGWTCFDTWHLLNDEKERGLVEVDGGRWRLTAESEERYGRALRDLSRERLPQHSPAEPDIETMRAEAARRRLVQERLALAELQRTRYAVRAARTPCSIDGCDGGVFTRGLCGSHYWRWQSGRPVEGPISRRSGWQPIHTPTT